MLLQQGDKIFVAHRRLFPQDQPRFFAGTVEDYELGVAKVRGHSWVREPVKGEMHCKTDPRTKLIALASGTCLIYQLPAELDLDDLRIHQAPAHALLLTDGGTFRMDITDRVPTGLK